jgi:hypothetical protein
MLDEAEASGIVGDAFRSAQEKMVIGIERLVDLFEALARKMGVDLPEKARTGVDGVNRELDRIHDREVTVHVNYDEGEFPDHGNSNNSFAMGGISDFGAGTQAVLHGLEAVVPLGGGPVDSAVHRMFDQSAVLQELRALRRLFDDLPDMLARSVRAAVMLAKA